MASPRLLVPTLLLLPLAGCPDQPPPDPGITIHGDGAALVAIKDGDEAWRTVGLSANGAAVVPVTGPYQVARVCGFQNSVEVAAVQASVDDDTEWQLDCWYAQPFNVTIESVGNLRMSVYIGDGYGEPLLSVKPGRYDLLAIEETDDPAATPRFVIQRAVAIDEATTIRIDLAADGIPLQRRPVEVAGARFPLTLVSSDVALAGGDRPTRGGLPRAGEREVFVIPETSLVNGDTETASAVALYGDAGPHQRATIDARVPADVTLRLTLPEPVESAAIDWSNGPSATWIAAGDWSVRGLAIYGSGGNVAWGVTANPGWLTDVGQLDEASVGFPDLAAIPGWQPTWNVVPDAASDWHLSLRADRMDVTEGISYSEFRAE